MSQALPAYAELHALTNFTFLRGASHPEEMVLAAQELGYGAIAITDECSMAGVVRAHVYAKRKGMPLIVGSEIALTDDGPKLVLLAQTRAGYGNLCELISFGRMRPGVVKGSYRLTRADLDGTTAEVQHLAGVPECSVLVVPHAQAPLERTLAHARWARRTFGAQRTWLAVERHRGAFDRQLVTHVELVAAETQLKIVAAGGALMHVRSCKPLQDTLTAIRLRKPLHACGMGLEPNADAYLRLRMDIARLMRPEWMAETLAVAQQCTFSLDELAYEYPREIVPAGETPTTWLRKLTAQGVRRRYGRALPPGLLKQLRRELLLIAELRYEAFFLTIEDIVRYARSQGVLCQGRGSAANSAVCFVLGITEVRPEQSKLLFERFISRARNEPPDIDVDFEHQRREIVIQYIYAKYGRDRAALAATVIRYRPRSALRDVGKALGLDEQRIAVVSKSHQWWDGKRIDIERLAECGFDLRSPIVRLWVEITNTLVGFPRHLSQHVGGFVIAQDRLTRLVPVETTAMEGRSVIEWDKDDLEALKLLKVDVLALGMLSALRRALELVSRKLQRPPDRPFLLQDIPPDDGPTYDMICDAQTVGTFQIESRAQMSMLPRLKPRRLYDLVVQVAIVRPGPIQGGMVHPYLRRREGLEKEDYPKDELREALERTLGVPIFQEQVMQIAMIAAEFTPDEADALRRAMAAWQRKGGLGAFHDKLVNRMVERGYARDFAERIYSQAQGFGEYGFPESHAFGFGQLAYMSSWLKCHHPDAFLAAMLNSQPLGFYGPAQLVQDARRNGVRVLPVDVGASDWECTLDGTTIEADGDASSSRDRASHGSATQRRAEHARFDADPFDALPVHAPLRAVRLGLNCISGINEAAAQRIADERMRAPFIDTEDLARRCNLNARELNALAAANALASLAGHRRQARWQVAGLAPMPAVLRDARVNEARLTLDAPSEGDDIVADYASLRLTLNRHPLALLRERLMRWRFSTAQTLSTVPSGRRVSACGIVTTRQRPGTAKGTLFVTIEDETGSINVIVKPALVERQRKEVLAAALLGVTGTWQRDGLQGRVMHLVAHRLVDHSRLLGRLATSSRDFH